jgi:DNA-binding transcriptional MerR regulator
MGDTNNTGHISVTDQGEKQMGYSGKSTAEIVGITYRQLDYWARTDLIRPSLTDASGSGSRREYSYRNLLELKVVKNLLDSGIRLEQVREVFAYLQDELGEDVATANLVVNGSQPTLVRSGAEVVDLLAKGQGVLNILPLSGVIDELDEAIVELFPSRSAVARNGLDDVGAVAAH